MDLATIPAETFRVAIKRGNVSRRINPRPKTIPQPVAWAGDSGLVNDVAPYQNAADVLADRVHWATALLSHLVNRARSEGWLEGDLHSLLPCVERIEVDIQKRVATSDIDVST